MIAAAMRDMVARLQAGGVRAGLSAADLAPPAVLVRWPDTSEYRLSGTVCEARWSLLAAVPDAGAASVDGLSELVERTRAALGYEVTATYRDVVTLTEGPPVPACRIELTTDIGG